MKTLPLRRRTWTLIAVILPLLALLVYVALRSGPLAPMAVTVGVVEKRAIQPALFGIGPVEARYTYKIGPTFAGRVKSLAVHVGERVEAGQILGEMDPVDLNDRIRSQHASIRRTEAVVREAQAKHAYALAQTRRYARLFETRSTSKEMLETKRQELQIAEAGLAAARDDLARTRADLDALLAQRTQLKLAAPVSGVVVARDSTPGSTVVAGQSVVEMVDPHSLWINARFNQLHSGGLQSGLKARIVLRSRSAQSFEGSVLRVDPLADYVTEETMAKVQFDRLPNPLPPIGELAEVTVKLPRQPMMPVIPNAAVRIEGNKIGVWLMSGGSHLRFMPVVLGSSDLDGYVQIIKGLAPGDRIVVYSQGALSERSRVHVVKRISGVAS